MLINISKLKNVNQPSKFELDLSEEKNMTRVEEILYKEDVVIKHVSGLHKLRKEIKHSDDKDKFLEKYSPENYDDKKKIYFLDEKSATEKLYNYNNNVYELIIKKFEELDLDILIGGSSGVASVLNSDCHEIKFKPQDIDMYVKKISNEKICLIDKAIRELFKNEKIILVRRPLTIAWWVFDNDENLLQEVQLNILKIESWAEVFISYHSEIVTIGYDIKKSEFITLKDRWTSFVNKFPLETMYFTNLNSLDSDVTITTAIKKYIKRGFLCEGLVFKPKIEYSTKVVSVTNVSGTRESDNIDTDVKKIGILETLSNTYSKCNDITINSTIEGLFSDEFEFANMINIKNLFIKYPDYMENMSQLEPLNGVECPITMEKSDLYVANKHCRHDISLKSYILSKDTMLKCPICREVFKAQFYNITSDRPEVVSFKIEFNDDADDNVDFNSYVNHMNNEIPDDDYNPEVINDEIENGDEVNQSVNAVALLEQAIRLSGVESPDDDELDLDIDEIEEIYKDESLRREIDEAEPIEYNIGAEA
jgi:hypothetical protein